MSGLRLMRAILYVSLVSAAPPAPAAAQDSQSESSADAVGTPLAVSDGAGEGPRKIDEFGRVGGCDHSARLDNFAIELMNNPDAVGYVIAYGPAGKGNGTAFYRAEVSKNYLVNSRGLAPERIRAVNGGRHKARDESVSELWLIPPGSEPPPPSNFENDAATFRGLFAERETWDGLDFYDAGTGPPVGDTTLAGFVDALMLQPETRAYLIAYSGEESAPGAWRRVSRREAESLSRAGVSANRVRVIYGGQAKELKMQLWILPADAPQPVADAGAEPRPTGAAQLGGFDAYVLRYEENQQYALKGLGDVLKSDEALNAFVIVRLKTLSVTDAEVVVETEAKATDSEATAEAETLTGTNEVAETEEDEDGEEAEPPDVDLAQLAEKWRGELIKEYGVGAHRIVVVIVPPRGEWETGAIETWVVPPGATAPDPFKDENVDTEAVEEINEGATDNGSHSSDPDRAEAVRGREE